MSLQYQAIAKFQYTVKNSHAMEYVSIYVILMGHGHAQEVDILQVKLLSVAMYGTYVCTVVMGGEIQSRFDWE